MTAKLAPKTLYEQDYYFLKSKTLKNYILEEFDSVYEKARKIAIDKTGLPANTFPPQCPFTIEEVLHPDFLPE